VTFQRRTANTNKLSRSGNRAAHKFTACLSRYRIGNVNLRERSVASTALQSQTRAANSVDLELSRKSWQYIMVRRPGRLRDWLSRSYLFMIEKTAGRVLRLRYVTSLSCCVSIVYKP